LRFFLSRLIQSFLCRQAVGLSLKPDRFRKEARQIGLVGAVQNAAGDVRQTLVGEHHQPGQVVLEMPELALILKQVGKRLGMGHYQRRRTHDRQLH